MQVATRAMTPTGMYPLLGYSWELHLPTGVQYVDGADGARKAVREQISHGADVAVRKHFLESLHLGMGKSAVSDVVFLGRRGFDRDLRGFAGLDGNFYGPSRNGAYGLRNGNRCASS